MLPTTQLRLAPSDDHHLSSSYIPPWGVVDLHIGVRHSNVQDHTPGRVLYNLLPRQHHYTREIWATFLDVAWAMGYIMRIVAHQHL